MMRGRHVWSGALTHENSREVAELVRKLLDGKKFTFIAANGNWGFKPEARPSRQVREFRVFETTGAGDMSGFSIADDDYVTGVHTWLSRDEASRRPREDRTHIEISEYQVIVEQYLPRYERGGQKVRLWWMWSVEGEPV